MYHIIVLSTMPPDVWDVLQTFTDVSIVMWWSSVVKPTIMPR